MAKGMYVDGFVLVVPKKNVAAYSKIAKEAGKIWMKCGALSYYECKGDDMKPKWTVATFPKVAKATASDTVWFSFIVFKNKKHRDMVNAKVMKDPYMTNQDPKKPMPFDMKRMSYGGFEAVVAM